MYEEILDIDDPFVNDGEKEGDDDIAEEGDDEFAGDTDEIADIPDAEI